MTLKTVTGPSIRAALADARRLFGAEVLLLESRAPAGNTPARVTVAFDEAPTASAPPRKKLSVTDVAPKRVPEEPEHWADLMAAPPPVTPQYGYPKSARTRKASPSKPETVSASTPVPPSELDMLRQRVAELEAVMSQKPQPVAELSTLVFVGPAGAGKTSLALHAAQQPHLVGARCPAVLLFRPDDSAPDPMSLFWAAGVPVATIRNDADAAQALIDFADADLLIVDTPSLSLSPEGARPQVAALGKTLQALAPLDVHFVLDASRSTDSFDETALHALGIHPDALALTRADEATENALKAWPSALRLPLLLVSEGPTSSDVTLAPPAPAAEAAVLNQRAMKAISVTA